MEWGEGEWFVSFSRKQTWPLWISAWLAWIALGVGGGQGEWLAQHREFLCRVVLKRGLHLKGWSLVTNLYPTLRMDVMLLRILCQAGLKRMRCCQVTGKYALGYKKTQLKCWCACRDALWRHIRSQSGMKCSGAGARAGGRMCHFMQILRCFSLFFVSGLSHPCTVVWAHVIALITK